MLVVVGSLGGCCLCGLERVCGNLLGGGSVRFGVLVSFCIIGRLFGVISLATIFTTHSFILESIVTVPISAEIPHNPHPLTTISLNLPF